MMCSMCDLLCLLHRCRYFRDVMHHSLFQQLRLKEADNLLVHSSIFSGCIILVLTM